MPIPTDYEVLGQMSLFDFPDDFGAGKTSPEPSVQTEAKTSVSSSKRSQGSSTRRPLYLCLQKEGGLTPASWTEMDTRLPGESLMHNSNYRKDGDDYTLSQILEDTAPQKYFLSVRACLGILRRSQKRGKTLPEVLMTALIAQAGLSWEEYHKLQEEWAKEN